MDITEPVVVTVEGASVAAIDVMAAIEELARLIAPTGNRRLVQWQLTRENVIMLAGQVECGAADRQWLDWWLDGVRRALSAHCRSAACDATTRCCASARRERRDWPGSS